MDGHLLLLRGSSRVLLSMIGNTEQDQTMVVVVYCMDTYYNQHYYTNKHERSSQVEPPSWGDRRQQDPAGNKRHRERRRYTDRAEPCAAMIGPNGALVSVLILDRGAINWWPKWHSGVCPRKALPHDRYILLCCRLRFVLLPFPLSFASHQL